MCFYFVVAKSRRSYQRPADNLEWWFMAPLQLKILWHKASIISIFSVTIKENRHLTLRKGEGYGFFFHQILLKIQEKKICPCGFQQEIMVKFEKKNAGFSCWIKKAILVCVKYYFTLVENWVLYPFYCSIWLPNLLMSWV